MREAVVVPSGAGGEVVITLDALEGFANRRLGAADALGLVVAEANVLRRAANATPDDDGTTTLTRALLLERSWTLEAHTDE